MNGDEVVTPSAHGERARKISGLKIGNEKDDCAPRYDLVQIIKRERRLGPAALRFKVNNIANNAQCVRAAFLRRKEMFDAIGEKEQADLVVVTNGAEREQARD